MRLTAPRESDEPKPTRDVRRDSGTNGETGTAVPVRITANGTPMSLDTYLRHRRAFEIAFWVAFFTIQWVANTWVVLLDIGRLELDFEGWEPAVWEGSSILVQGLLIPAILVFDRRFPLVWERLPGNLAAHALFTIPFSLAHVLGMVAIRDVAYELAGTTYDFGAWPRELFYEYLKDFRAYAGFVALIYLYRFVLNRLQGEASLLGEPDEGLSEEPEDQPERLLVKKLGREFLVNVNDIEWLEAAGNYVNLHVGGRVYPLRATMTGIERRLDSARFVRVHRSYMVNLDRVKEIEPLETGDARMLLASGTRVPLSRRYRAALRQTLE